MTTPIVAELIRNPGEFAENIREDQKGWQGLRNYEVNTSNPALALLADGIPKRGDPWTSGIADLSDLRVTERETFLISSRDSGDGSGGWTRVQVLYQTPQASAIRVPADVNARWTDISVSRGQFNLIRAMGLVAVADDGSVTGPEIGQVDAIDNGRGCNVDYGILECRVFTFMPRSAGYDVGRLAGLMRPSKINQNPLRLPPLYGDRLPIELGKGQVRYVNFEASMLNPEVRQLVHVLEISRDFYARWSPLEANGQPMLGQTYGSRVYDYADLGGLW
jgi:hypothetical protein